MSHGYKDKSVLNMSSLNPRSLLIEVYHQIEIHVYTLKFKGYTEAQQALPSLYQAITLKKCTLSARHIHTYRCQYTHHVD